MQLANWIATTNISWLQGIPDWAGTWFSIFPNVQTIVAQGVAVLIVTGSYFLARSRILSGPVTPRSERTQR